MKVVSPFRPFVPESVAHRTLGPFDWIAALRTLRASVDRACGCETLAITDVDTDLPVPAHRYETRHRRLMLWILEVARAYLASSDFDQDTVMLSPDLLVFHDLRGFFRADLGVVVRLQPKYLEAGRPLLNGVQFWRLAAQPRLLDLYARALAIAETLPESRLRWGADTDPLVQLLGPFRRGVLRRGDLSVAALDEPTIMRALTADDIARLTRGRTPVSPTEAVIDFRYLRKRHLAAYAQATIGSAVSA